MLNSLLDKIECGLTDENAIVRVAFATREDYTPTPAQVERGLTDRDSLVRLAFAEREDYTPTPAQVERGLTDEDELVKHKFAERIDYIATPAQIERGLTDENVFIRMAFATRKDYIPTPAQIDRGLTDGSELVRAAYAGWNKSFNQRTSRKKPDLCRGRMLGDTDLVECLTEKFRCPWESHYRDGKICKHPSGKQFVLKATSGRAIECRRHGFDRRQQHLATYANCTRAFSRRAKSSSSNMTLS